MNFKLGIYNVFFTEQLLSVFDIFKQSDSKSNESGGILLGMFTEENDIIVNRCSLPNKFDKATRYSFVRNKYIAQLISDYEFYNSKGYVVYLGEWHTHPEEVPNPSKQDIDMIKSNFKNSKLSEKVMLLVIVGLKAITVLIYDGSSFKKCVCDF